MWTETDVCQLMGLIELGIATDFGLDEEMVNMSIQQAINEFMAKQHRDTKAALKRCTFEVIKGGKDA